MNQDIFYAIGDAGRISLSWLGAFDAANGPFFFGRRPTGRSFLLQYDIRGVVHPSYDTWVSVLSSEEAERQSKRREINGNGHGRRYKRECTRASTTATKARLLFPQPHREAATFCRSEILETSKKCIAKTLAIHLHSPASRNCIKRGIHLY